MVTILPKTAKTRRRWVLRDDINQNYFNDILENEPIVTLHLLWKPDKDGDERTVARYSLNLPELVREGFVKELEGGFLLRFQRKGNLIQIARKRSESGLTVGSIPRNLLPLA